MRPAGKNESMEESKENVGCVKWGESIPLSRKQLESRAVWGGTSAAGGGQGQPAARAGQHAETDGTAASTQRSNCCVCSCWITTHQPQCSWRKPPGTPRWRRWSAAWAGKAQNIGCRRAATRTKSDAEGQQRAQSRMQQGRMHEGLQKQHCNGVPRPAQTLRNPVRRPGRLDRLVFGLVGWRGPEHITLQWQQDSALTSTASFTS